VDSRYLHRGKFPWDKEKKKKKKGSIEERVYSGILRLEQLRRKNRAFSSLADTWILDAKNNHILAFGRYYEGEKILCFYNFSMFDEIAYVNEVEDYKDMLSGEKRKARNVQIPAHDFIWLKTSF
jgi:possible amylosucrase